MGTGPVLWKSHSGLHQNSNDLPKVANSLWAPVVPLCQPQSTDPIATLYTAPILHYELHPCNLSIIELSSQPSSSVRRCSASQQYHKKWRFQLLQQKLCQKAWPQAFLPSVECSQCDNKALMRRTLGQSPAAWRDISLPPGRCSHSTRRCRPHRTLAALGITCRSPAGAAVSMSNL